MKVNLDIIINIMEKDMMNGNIIYELINGNGKVKEYDDDGNLKYEGEYLNGKRNGKGKEYSCEGNLLFEGEYLNNKKIQI